MARSKGINFQLVDNIDSLRNSISELEGEKELAVDCEGVSLSRTGKLCLVQVSTTTKVFLFDVITLGRKVFDQGLRDILEDVSITKIFFDCREDCNSLKYQYDVDVEGIMDVQLMIIVQGSLARKRTDFVCGLKKAMQSNLTGCGFSESDKEEMHRAFAYDKELWTRRPLKQSYLEYAATDVFYLIPLKERILSKITSQGMPLSKAIDVTKYASERYADFARDNDAYVEGSCYFGHPRLPLRIVPQLTVSRRDYIPFDNEGKKCSSCGQHHERRTAQCSRCIAIDQNPRK